MLVRPLLVRPLPTARMYTPLLTFPYPARARLMASAASVR